MGEDNQTMKRIKKLESMQGSSFFPVYLMGTVLTKKIKGVLRVNLSKTWNLIINDDLDNFFVYEDEWENICESAVKKIVSDKEFVKKIEKSILIKSKRLIDFSNKLTKINMQTKSNKQLLVLLKKFSELTEDIRIEGWVPNLVNLKNDNIIDIARKSLSLEVPEYLVNELFSKLTAPTQRMHANKAEITLLKIMKKGENPKLLKDYLKKYAYINYYYKGPVMSMDNLLYDIKEKRILIKDVKAKIKEIKNYPKDTEKEQKKLLRKYNLSKETRRLLEDVKIMTFLKAYRKEVMTYSNYKIGFVLDEIAKGLKTNRNIIRNLLPEEIEEHLLKNRSIDESKIKPRLKELIYCCEHGKVFLEKNRLIIKELKRLINKKEETGITELRGQSAYCGHAKGFVKIVESRKDMAKMKKGDILVSRSTNPDIITAMEKAAAIVTDMGGITCHAAIVSRELKKPCVIGTKIASKVLKDGDILEVDANQGTVKIIK